MPAPSVLLRVSSASRLCGGRRAASFVVALALCLALPAQDRHPITGRRYANVMGVAGADWLTRPERETEEQPDRALDLIGVPKAGVLADVGAGNGYMTWRLAERTGPRGKVYAVDIQREMLDLLRRNMRARQLENVEPILGTIDDPKLPPSAVDLILLVDVYHEFSEPQKMLLHMRESLKPDGRLVLLEYRGEDPTIPIRPEHKMTVQQVKAELEPEGFHLDKLIDALPRQHILIFRKVR
jgi:SAM-dependent methyltransferase